MKFNSGRLTLKVPNTMNNNNCDEPSEVQSEYVNVDDNSDEEIVCLGSFTSSTDLSQNTQLLNIKEESIKIKNDRMNTNVESPNEILEKSHKKQQNVNVYSGCPSLRISKNLFYSRCHPKEGTISDIPSIFDHEVQNSDCIVKKINSNETDDKNPSKSDGLFSNQMHNLSNTVVSNKKSISGSQQTFGKEIKQVRYVTLPAKFLSGKMYKQTSNGVSTANKVVNTHSVNKSIQKSNLPSENRYTTQSSLGIKLLVSDISGSGNSVPMNKNLHKITKSNCVKDDKPVTQPPMLLLNNQVIKLRGIKQPELSLRDKSGENSKSQGVDQGCQTEDLSKSVVDQSCQTYVYSWLYKNSKLYTFIDDGGKQVEIVPIVTAKIVNQTDPVGAVKIGNGERESNIASPLSSLDNESDILEDETYMSDDPDNHVTKSHHPSVDASIQTDSVEAGVTSGQVQPTHPQNPPFSYQPQNTFQEVLFNELGLYNNCGTAPRDDIQQNPSAYQSESQNYLCRLNQDNTDTNAGFSHELQTYDLAVNSLKPQPVLEQPAAHNPVNANPVFDIFYKLIEDIKTCLSSDALGNIPIHQAVINGDLARLKSQCVVLKTIGSHLNHINLTHETALMLAVKVAVETNDYEAVSVLVSEGADQRIADLGGDTPLHYAVRHGHQQLVRVLLSADDADKITEKYNYEGLTPLHIAAMEGHDDIIKQLVSTNIDINVKDRKTGRTPYFLAVREKKLTSAKLLRMFGADVHEPNFADQTPQLIVTHGESISSVKNQAKVGVNVSLETFIEHFGKRNLSETSLEERAGQYVYFDRTYTGLSSPLASQTMESDEQNLIKKNVDKSREVLSDNNIRKKSEINSASKKSDYTVDDYVSIPKSVHMNENRLEPDVLSKLIDGNLKSKNITLQCLGCDSSESINDKEGFSLTNSKYKQTNASQTVDRCNIFKVPEISINNHSVTHNKAVLNIFHKNREKSNETGQTYENVEIPKISFIGDQINRITKLSHETVHDNNVQMPSLEDSESLTLVNHSPIEDMTPNHYEPNLTFEMVSENSVENYQASSIIYTNGNPTTHPQHNSDSINECRTSNENQLSKDPIDHLSKAHLPECHESLEKESSDLMKQTLAVESQGKSKFLSAIITHDMGKKDSNRTYPVSSNGHSSFVSVNTSRTLPRISLEDTPDKMPNSPEERNETCQSSNINQNFTDTKTSEDPGNVKNFTLHSLSDDQTRDHTTNQDFTSSADATCEKISSHISKEKERNSLSRKDDVKLENKVKKPLVVNQVMSNLSEYEPEKIETVIHPPLGDGQTKKNNSSRLGINRRKRSNQISKEKKQKSQSPKRGPKSRRKANKSLGVNQVTSINEKPKYSQSNHLCKSSQEKPHENLRNVKSIQMTEHCDSSSTLNDDFSSVENSGKEFGKEYDDNESNNLIVESKTYCNSDEDDDGNSLEETSSLSLNFGNVKDVIIGDDDFILNCEDQDRQVLLPEPEQVQFDDLLDDVVGGKKEIVSSKKLDKNSRRSCKRKRVDSQVPLSQDQITDSRKSKQKIDLNDKVHTAATGGSKSAASLYKVGTSGSDQTINAKLSDIFPDTGMESKSTNTNILTKNIPSKKVNPQKRKNDNLEASKKPLDCPESNKKPIPRSPSSFVTNMRNRLVSLVSCKPLLPPVKVSNDVIHTEVSPPIASASNQNENVHYETSGEGSSKPQTTASEQNLAEDIRKPTKSPPNPSSIQPQTNRSALRLNSSDLKPGECSSKLIEHSDPNQSEEIETLKKKIPDFDREENIIEPIKYADPYKTYNIHSEVNKTDSRKSSSDSNKKIIISKVTKHCDATPSNIQSLNNHTVSRKNSSDLNRGDLNIYTQTEPADLNSSQSQINWTASRKMSYDSNQESTGKSIKLTDLNPSNIQPKSNITASRKRSYDSDGSEGSGKRRISNDDQTEVENKNVDTNSYSRRSARIPKKKISFNL